MNPAATVHVLVPEGIEDTSRPSGGNVYDLRLCAALGDAGWSVRRREIAGRWPDADRPALRSLAAVVASVPDRSVVLVDGLVASVAPDVLVPEARRVRLVVLVHQPRGHVSADDGWSERAVLGAASGVVATSRWTRGWLVAAYGLDPSAVDVAVPGVDRAPVAAGTSNGGSLLCVASVTPGKGHDLLVTALEANRDLPWRCLCVGSLTRAPEFVRRLRGDLRATRLGDRVRLAGPRTGPPLEASYAAADALLLATRAEAYGMVVAEALARGIPVLASDVGGVREALGVTADGTTPGMLVAPGDAAALARAVRRWLGDGSLRRTLRSAARRRRQELPGWPQTAHEVSRVLEQVSA